ENITNERFGWVPGFTSWVLSNVLQSVRIQAFVYGLHRSSLSRLVRVDETCSSTKHHLHAGGFCFVPNPRQQAL
ncbi:hypothetical protein T265_10982, partial [Opisthorchis viverrini]